MAEKYVVALDQGTTSSRAIVFDHESTVRGVAQREFTQGYPRPGWVEHDPREIWSSQQEVLHAALRQADVTPDQLSAIGITNQRETTILWNRKTGEPVHNAIVWQCRRTSSICDDLVKAGHEPMIYEKTGLVVDAYFSGTKIKWLLDNVPVARSLADAGDLAFGTVDSWLLWNLTGGKVHATDVTNAGRTMLFNIHSLDWDDELLALLGIPRSIMPEVAPSSGTIGTTSPDIFPGVAVPIAGIAGDQHAALFGQTCFTPGMVKNTYGTGCFVLVNTGEQAIASENRLLTTPAWSLEKGRVTYAMEGSIFIAGAAIQWLRDSMKLITTASESEYFATQVDDSAGVYVVPAFVGLGAPHWDSYARGGVFGLTAGSGRNHIVRATLESIAYQSRDVVEAMAKDGSGTADLRTMLVDGGASANNFLMQFQADILGIPVERPVVAETTALGAAYLAGLATGFWSGLEEIRSAWKLDRRFEPKMSADERDSLYAGWQEAVRRVRGWERE
ncbi:MAG TPA: glycerol kinase GlpK [Spirochaetia bacterium]|nr:glycerol kinase GlpK [Spirochaetia bacterium]